MLDYNADPNKGGIWPEIRELVHSNQLKLGELQISYDTSSYQSAAHNSTS